MTTFNQIAAHKKHRPIVPGWWTPERTERLCAMWRDGANGTQIALELGTTRNAVRGRLHRLGLKEDDRTTPAPVVVVTPPRTPPPVPPPPRPPAAAERISIFDLTNETCRWPFNDGMFCGKREADLNNRMPYCRHHAGIAWPRREGI